MKKLSRNLFFMSAAACIAGTGLANAQSEGFNFRYSRMTSAQEALQVNPVTIPDLYRGESASVSLGATGGSSPFTWSILSGSLPSGLTQHVNTGVINGSPTQSGTFDLAFRVVDANGVTIDLEPLTIHVYDPVSVSVISSDFLVGDAVSVPLELSGGKGPFTYQITEGSLPSGLSISGGRIAGSPTAKGTFSAVIRVSDANGRSDTASFESVVREGLVAGSFDLPDGYVGEAFSSSFTASGGVPPYAWELMSGMLPSGLSLNENGEVSGTPAAAGTSDYQVIVLDSDIQDRYGSGSMSVFDLPQVAQSTIGPLRPNVSVDIALSAEGGKPNLTWSSNGTLPPGLSLNPAGRLTGAPSTIGTFVPNLSVADVNSRQSAPRPVTIHVYDLIAASIPSFAEAYVGDSVSLALTSSGGKTPHFWEASNLPAGLAINDGSGQISGSPTTAGSTTAKITVTDDLGTSASYDLPYAVYDPPAISNAPANELDLNAPFSHAYSVTGGKAPYTWAIAQNSLPTGLSLDPAGQISGTPTETGSFEFEVHVSDANGRSDSQTETLSVFDNLVALVGSAPDGYLTTAFSHTVSAEGGKAPLTFSSANLPEGLLLDAGTGLISGTPTAVGASTATVTVTDARGTTTSDELAIGVYALPEITNAPVSELVAGSAYSHTFTAAGGKDPLSWSLKSGTLPAGMSLSESGVLTGSPSAAGSFSFTVEVADANGRTASSDVSMSVFSVMALDAGTAPDGYLTTAFSHTVSASGGKTPHSFTISGQHTGLTINPSTGVISGTPTASGSRTATVIVSDARGTTATAPLPILVYALPEVSNTPAAELVAGTAYSHTFTASGGKAPLTWSRKAGALPAGMSLSSEGVLTGTPSAVGTVNFTVEVADANGKTATRDVTTNVFAVMAVNAGTAPDGYLSTAFSHTVTASGGKAPYSYALSGQQSGLTINASTGAISGTPTATGEKTATVTVTDARGTTASASLPITVYALPTISNAPATELVAGTAYSHAFTASGGKGPFTWSRKAGALPTGMSLSAAGVLTGTPSAAGTFSFTVEVADANGKTASRDVTTNVYAVLAANPGSAPNGYLSTAFSHSVTATGGKTPYTWSITGQHAGLTINASTGVVSGTPTATGMRTATITVTDARGTTANASLPITVYALPTISNAPATSGKVGTAVNFTYTVSGGKAPYTWSRSSGAFPAGLSLNASTGALTGTPSSAQSYSFTVQVTDANGKTATKASTMTIAPNEVVATISSSTTNVNVQSLFGSNWTANVSKRLVINSGVTVGATTTSYAMTIPGGWAGTLTIQNNGSIQGIGGAANSGTGGNAINIAGLGNASQKVIIQNAGSIYAGGGGGGKGGNGGNGTAATTVREPASGDHYTVPPADHTTENGPRYYWTEVTGAFPGKGLYFGHIWPDSVNRGDPVSGTSYTRDGWTYHRGTYRHSRPVMWVVGDEIFYGIYRTRSTTTTTTGGAGGSGGRGQGYNGALANGANGAAGGANAGAGGKGGNGGSWGVAGGAGSTGANGNASNGTAGAAGGLAGYAIVNATYATYSGSGQKLGR